MAFAIVAGKGGGRVSSVRTSCYSDPMSSGRWVLAAACGALLLLLGIWLSPSGETVEYATTPAERGPIVAEVTATGRVEPRQSVEVGTYVSGPILEVDVDFNTKVRAGQRLARIDPRTFEGKVAHAVADLTLAEARVERAVAALELEQSKLRRSKSLAGKAVVSSEELEIARSNERQAEAEVSVARAEVERARATLAEAEVNLSYADIVSPIDGIVISRSVDVGQTVAATFQTPVLFVIANDLEQMQVLAFVNEADVGRVREGQVATFTVDAFPGRPFEAVVRQVRHASEGPETQEPVISYVVTYDVVLDVENLGGLLRPGMTANVRVVTAEADDVLKVPTAALRFRPPGSKVARTSGDDGAVYRLESGEPVAVSVTLGLSDDQLTAVSGGGLAAGDDVVTRMQVTSDEGGWALFGRRRR
ncbi:MAG: efflux RND transporter periplasmic adaptor subunit [Candidatus Binatia bacterium]|nr:efflux RND transporter periplasmic adaptor subunit [Candidatus Binatia bacterium]